MKKKLICLLLAVSCLLSCFPLGAAAAGPGLDNFYNKYEYREGLFRDVESGFWYGQYVAKVYALGLMQGRDTSIFAPGETITIAETITLAARLHNIYNGGDGVFEPSEPWYQTYVDYALENGIIHTDKWGYFASATRRRFVSIIAAAMPAGEFAVISDVPDNMIPDIKNTDHAAGAIYRLYRAGVLTGSDVLGTFHPEEYITRSAVAAIVSRMADKSLRVEFSLNPYKGPEPPMQPVAGDDFFADACILGNSLVEGIRIYSGLKSMTYYSYTGMTVISAASNKNYILNSGYYGTALDAMAQHDYSKVYIELGINEIGFPVETFTAYYRKIIERIQADQPDADIYILSLTPVSRAKDAGGTFTMARVNNYNAGLKALAEDMEIYFIDCVTPLVDSTGFLAPGDTWDGVHFNIPKYYEWENIIRTRYVN